MVIVDIPVQFQQGIVHQQLSARRYRRGADIEAIVIILGDRLSSGNCGIGNTDVGLVAAQRAKRWRGARAFQALFIGEEEQFVLDQRAADGNTLGRFAEWFRSAIGILGIAILSLRKTK